MTLLLAALAVFVGCFCATISGFGFALISTPLLSMILSPVEAIILIPILTVVLRIVTMYRVRELADLKLMGNIMAGWVIGVLPGAYVLHFLSVQQLQLFLGICLLAATYVMGKKYYIPIANKTFGRAGAGFWAGFFGTSTSVSGPPIVLYFLNEKFAKDYMRANMIWVFGAGNLISTLMNIIYGNAKAVRDWNTFLLLVPVVILAAYCGEKAFKYVNQELFRRISLGIVLCGSVMMLYNGLKGLW